MRGEVAALGRPVQTSFLARREDVYRELIEWLITLGRLGEAEQVMTMLKEEEYFDAMRSDLRPSMWWMTIGPGGVAMSRIPPFSPPAPAPARPWRRSRR